MVEDMDKKLKDCDIGDYVSIWCIGTLCWDDEICKIIDNGFFVKVQYKSGRVSEFSGNAICKKINF